MNRNVESHFSKLPQVDIQRSRFDRSTEHITSLNVGELVPYFWDEVLPGDTFNVTTSIVARLQTLLTPIYGNLYIDTYSFFIPAYILWDHWHEFMGENTSSAWLPSTTYSVPYMSYPEGGFDVGTVADYLGIPVGVSSSNPDDCPMVLPFRAYAMICDQWFRDQNLTDPLNIPTGDSNQTGSNGSNYITDVVNGGKPFKVAKYHDYFTSALPAPQKGSAVSLPITGEGWAPVQARLQTSVPTVKDNLPPGYTVGEYDAANLVLGQTKRTSASEGKHIVQIDWVPPESGKYNGKADLRNRSALDSGSGSDSENLGLTPINLWANLSGSSFSAVTINDLRLAFQLQKFYEKNARAGTRYREILQEHFGVTSPDARMMIPEYLGGHRFPLVISQVANQAQSEGESLGDVGALSVTSDVHEDYIKSFTCHGFVMSVLCVRYDHAYPQGLEKAWSRRLMTDYYWPVFANLGEQPIKKREIYLADDSDTEANNGAVFGYQEYAAEYRYKPSRISGEMRPGITNSLASWHLADYYTSQPALSDSWIREEKTNVDRVLAVTSETANQIFADIYIKNIVTRPMPMYSIPGLVDHH